MKGSVPVRGLPGFWIQAEPERGALFANHPTWLGKRVMADSSPSNREVTLLVCTKERISSTNPSCGQRGSRVLVTMLADAIAQRHWPIHVKQISCLGECAKGPNVRIAPGGEMLHAVGPKDVPKILSAIEKFAGLS